MALAVSLASMLLAVCIPNFGWAQTVSEKSVRAANHVVEQPEFRIESKLFLADSKQPQTHNLTLFSKGVVYDFQRGTDPLAEPSEIVIYDSHSKKIALLELATQRKLEMHDITLLKLLDEARRQAEKDDRTRFLVYETYKEEVDVNRQSVTLSSESRTYRMEGIVPNSQQVMSTYFEFLDIFTRLQASDPRNLPPFPRIRLNQSIRRVGWMPTRVEVDIKKNALQQTPFNAHSQHELVESLLAEDRDRIADAKKKWLNFNPVSLAEYRGLEPIPKLQRLTRAMDTEDR